MLPHSRIELALSKLLRNEVGFWKSEAGLFKGEAIEAQRRLETQEGRISAVLRQTAEVRRGMGALETYLFSL